MGLGRTLALAAIRAYQRWISPNKGYGCAYRIHCGGAGCSGLGLRAIRWHGLVPGLAILRMRLARCSAVHRALHPPRRRHPQAGECDCGGCDAPDCSAGSDLCDLADMCSCCECDWPSRKGRQAGRRRDRFDDRELTRRRREQRRANESAARRE